MINYSYFVRFILTLYLHIVSSITWAFFSHNLDNFINRNLCFIHRLYHLLHRLTLEVFFFEDYFRRFNNLHCFNQFSLRPYIFNSHFFCFLVCSNRNSCFFLGFGFSIGNLINVTKIALGKSNLSNILIFQEGIILQNSSNDILSIFVDFLNFLNTIRCSNCFSFISSLINLGWLHCHFNRTHLYNLSLFSCFVVLNHSNKFLLIDFITESNNFHLF